MFPIDRCPSELRGLSHDGNVEQGLLITNVAQGFLDMFAVFGHAVLFHSTKEKTPMQRHLMSAPFPEIMASPVGLRSKPARGVLSWTIFSLDGYHRRK